MNFRTEIENSLYHLVDGDKDVAHVFKHKTWRVAVPGIHSWGEFTECDSFEEAKHEAVHFYLKRKLAAK